MPKSPHTQLSSRDLFIRINTTVNIRLFGGDLGIVKYGAHMAEIGIVSVIIWTFFVLKASNMFEIEARSLILPKVTKTQD